MKVSQAFPSKFLTAADLDGPTTFQIRDVTLEEVGSRSAAPELKNVVNFHGQKPWVLNKTNAKRIREMHGDEMNDWSGKSVTLYPTDTPFGDEMVACIRVSPTAPPTDPSPDHEPPAADDLPI